MLIARNLPIYFNNSHWNKFLDGILLLYLVAKNIPLGLLHNVSNSKHISYATRPLEVWTADITELPEIFHAADFYSSEPFKIKRNVRGHKNVKVHKNEDHLLQERGALNHKRDVTR